MSNRPDPDYYNQLEETIYRAIRRERKEWHKATYELENERMQKVIFRAVRRERLLWVIVIAITIVVITLSPFIIAASIGYSLFKDFQRPDYSQPPSTNIFESDCENSPFIVCTSTPNP